MICRAGGVGVMLGDAQVGLVHVVVQPIEDIRRLAHRRGEHLRMERPILARHVGVKNRAGIDAVLGVDGAAGSRTAAGAEVLAVRG